MDCQRHADVVSLNVRHLTTQTTETEVDDSGDDAGQLTTL